MTTAQNMLSIIRTNSVSYPSAHCVKVNEEKLVAWKTKTIKLLISLLREKADLLDKGKLSTKESCTG